MLYAVHFSSVQFLDRLGRRENMRNDSREILFQSSLQHGQGCPLSDVVHPAFPLPTTASPTLHCVLKDRFGEVFVACDMSEPSKFQSLDSCQKRFLWIHKKADLAPHPVVGLVLQEGDSERFPQAHGVETLDPFFFFFFSQQAGSLFHNHREGWR